MSLLQFIVIIASVIFILFGRDIYKRQKATVLHFLVFFGWGALLLLFALDNNLLNRFWSVFGLTRGADLIVYVSIIILFYLFIDLYNHHSKDKSQLSSLISILAINDLYNQLQTKIYQKPTKKSNKEKMLFLIRAYNEEQTIGKVIDDIVQAWYTKIIIINDGSTDQTWSIVEHKQQSYPDILILHTMHSINRGGWAANRTGFNFVSKYAQELDIDRVITFDADGQMDVSDMKAFYHIMQSRPADIYIGSRFISGAQAHNIPSSRKIILYISHIVTRIFYGTKMSDPHNGFRVVSISTIQKIKITADGMHYANEINEQIKKYKLHYEEVPVHIRYTKYSLTKGQKNSNSIKLAIEMIYKKLFFR